MHYGDDRIDIAIVGGYYNDRYVRIDYRPRDADSAAVAFGAAILDFRPDGGQLLGEFVALGPKSGRIVSGSLSLT